MQGLFVCPVPPPAITRGGRVYFTMAVSSRFAHSRIEPS